MRLRLNSSGLSVTVTVWALKVGQTLTCFALQRKHTCVNTGERVRARRRVLHFPRVMWLESNLPPWQFDPRKTHALLKRNKLPHLGPVGRPNTSHGWITVTTSTPLSRPTAPQCVFAWPANWAEKLNSTPFALFLYNVCFNLSAVKKKKKWIVHFSDTAYWTIFCILSPNLRVVLYASMYFAVPW